MARRGRRFRRHSSMSGPRKWIKKGASLAGSVLGGLIAFSPTYRGLGNMVKSGDVAAGAKDILYDTTGISDGTGVDVGRIASTGVTVVAGLGVAWLFKQVAKRL